MPRILLTGATGFVGSHLISAWSGQGWDLHAISRYDRTGDGVAWHRWPDTPAAMAYLLRTIAPDAVVHLATLYIKDHRPEDVLPLVDANIRSGALLLEGCRMAGIRRLLTTGTAWQHFHRDDDEYCAANLYAATKQAFEDLLRYYVEAHNFRAIMLHLNDTYGPGDPRPKLFNMLAHAAASGEALDLSPGGQFVCPLHIDDVVSACSVAMTRLCRSESSACELFCVSGSETLTLRELVAIWQQASGLAPSLNWGARPYRDREIMRPWAGGDSLPGWSPSIPLAIGLAGLR